MPKSLTERLGHGTQHSGECLQPNERKYSYEDVEKEKKHAKTGRHEWEERHKGKEKYPS